MKVALDPFVAAMPAPVAELVVRGDDPAIAHWRRSSTPRRSLPGTDDGIHPDLVGWMLGISLFFDTEADGPPNRMQVVTDRTMGLAIAAGLAADPLPPLTRRHWANLTHALARISDATLRAESAYARAVPGLVTARAAAARALGIALARRIGAPARAAIVAAPVTRATQRLRDVALAALGDPARRDSGAELLVRELLEAWHATHDPALEPHLERIGRAVIHGRPPLEAGARTQTELEAHWHALAARAEPHDVGFLLAAPWPRHVNAAQKRVEALAQLPPDPRIAVALAMRAPSYPSEGDRLHPEIVKAIARAPTAAILPYLDGFEPMARGRQYRQLRPLVAALAIAPADPALLARAAATHPNELAALTAAHLANPGDLGARAVLGDALQQAGDPRGELIALQLASDRSLVAAPVGTLLDRHALPWIAALPGARWPRFERGCLVEVAIYCGGQSDLLARTAHRPEWVTVETLRVIDSIDPSPVLRRMPLLRRLEAWPRVLELVEQGGGSPTLRCIEVRDGAWLPAARAAFPALALLVADPATAFATPDAIERELRAAAATGIPRLVWRRFPRESLATLLALRAVGPLEIVVPLGPRSWLRVRNGGPQVDAAWDGGAGKTVGLRELVAACADAGVTQIAVNFGSGKRLRIADARGIAIVDGEPIDPYDHSQSPRT